MSSKGGGKKRRVNVRTAEERAAIVAESFEIGATVEAVAQRHGVQPSLLSSWRTASRRKAAGQKVEQSHVFAEVGVVPESAAFELIEIAYGPVVIRVPMAMPSKGVVEIARGIAQR